VLVADGPRGLLISDLWPLHQMQLVFDGVDRTLHGRVHHAAILAGPFR
jgi:hypothetical protein